MSITAQTRACKRPSAEQKRRALTITPLCKRMPRRSRFCFTLRCFCTPFGVLATCAVLAAFFSCLALSACSPAHVAAQMR